MSKKKAFTGSTMTLKDFHGGSIPSDLPLPSAPGVTVRPPDRPSYDRQSPWGGGGVGKGEYRGRPGSSSSSRAFDDKTLFLASSVNIGRNFDEDERKPIDGSSRPRRTVSDEILHPSGVRLEEKSGNVLSGSVSGKAGLGLESGIKVAGGPASSYVARVAHQGQVEVNRLSVGGQSGGRTNVWAARKEAAIVAEMSPHIWSEEVAASKLLNASALDKVSSGRWQTKLLVPQQTEVDNIQCLQAENGIRSKILNSHAILGIGIAEKEQLQDSVIAKDVERGLSFSDGGPNRHKDLSSSLQESAPIRKTSNDSAQSSKQSSGNPPSELSERPRLNLLPRSKPLEKVQPPAGEYNKNENILPIRPLSQPPQQLQATTEKERNTLFGSARPRELVLKERGLDSDATDLVQSPNRITNEALKPEVPHVKPSSRQYDNADSKANEQWVGWKMENKDNKVDNDRARPNWRSDGRKINVEMEKQQKERQPSPETWRKPEISPTVVRNGKAASAVELAQAFSRSTSDPNASERLRSLPSASNRNSVPFSRLTVLDSRSHIYDR